MTRFLRLLLPLFALTLLAWRLEAGLPDRPVFAHEESDLKPDPRARFGTLPNGLRYVVLPNAEPRERVSLRLVVMAGSLHETEEQRGLAHFLEHMAFNGSTHYPPGTLIEFFQRMGMSFGGDTNAHTSFDHTAYEVELPRRDSKTIEEGLRVLSDYAGGLLLGSEEIDRERGIILSEKRDRNSPALREWEAEAGFIFAGTLLPNRLPIGLEPVIQQAPRERFVSFYNTWYRPERLAVIAVGDFDPAAMEAQVSAAFAGLSARGPAAAPLDLGALKPFDRPRAFAHHEPESGATRVSIQSIREAAPLRDDAATRKARLLDALAVQMLNRRLEILARKPDSIFTYGSVSIDDAFNLYHMAGIELASKPEHWKAALVVAENELRRALQYGFTGSELEEARANVRNGLEEAVRTAETRHSNALANELLEALTQGEVFTTPADSLALLAPALDAASPAACTEALRAAFAGTPPVVTVIGNAKVADTPEAAEQAIFAVLGEAAAKELAPPADATVAPFGYTYFGDEGVYAISRKIEDLDLHLATLGNGVRLNLKKTDFEKGRVRILARVGGGQLTQPLDQPGLSFLADNAFFSAGLGKHSLEDLQRILAGKTVSLQMRVAPDAFVFTAETNEADLLLNLQLLTAYLVDPGYRSEALDMIRKQMEQFYTRVEHLPEGPLQMEIPRILSQGDPRFGLPRRSEALARNFDELRAWLTPEFATGPIEVSIVGDLELEAARKAVAQTLGALPKRATKPSYSEERKVAMPAPVKRQLPFQSEIPKAFIYVAWPTVDSRDISLTRQLNLLAHVFEDRLRTKVREELGDAYSPSAMSSPSDTYWGYGTFIALVSASPDKVESLTQVVLDIGRDLAAKGVTPDEVERAKQPVLTSIREAARTNPYWLQTVLASAQETPQRLDWRRSIESGHAAITAEQLSALAKRFLIPERAFRFSTMPVKDVPPEPTPAPVPQRAKPRPTKAPTPTPDPSRPTPTATPTPPDDF